MWCVMYVGRKMEFGSEERRVQMEKERRKITE